MCKFEDLTNGVYVHWIHDSEYKTFNTYGKVVGSGELELMPPIPYVDILTYDDNKIHQVRTGSSSCTDMRCVSKDTVYNHFDLKLAELELEHKKKRNSILETINNL